MDPLERALSELAKQVPKVQFVVGGGLGLVLRTRQAHSSGERTLRRVPEARSTEDMDLFLAAEIIADSDRVRELREALVHLGYTSVEGAEHYQFSRPVDTEHGEHRIKIDILAPFPADEKLRSHVRRRNRRIRPRDVEGIHAHVAPESCSVGYFPIAITLSDGTVVHVPHPYSFAILKLFAARDKMNTDPALLGPKHAFDIYTIIATFTAGHWDQVKEIRGTFPDPEVLRQATEIVHTLFEHRDSSGTQALRKQARLPRTESNELEVDAFLKDLHDLFPRPTA